MSSTTESQEKEPDPSLENWTQEQRGEYRKKHPQRKMTPEEKKGLDRMILESAENFNWAWKNKEPFPNR